MLFNRRGMLVAGGAFGLTGLANAKGLGLKKMAPLPKVLQPTGSVRSLYSRAMVIDCLAAPTSANIPFPPEGPLTPEQVRDARNSGITAMNFTVSKSDYEGSKGNLDFWVKELALYPETYSIIDTHADLLSAKREGKVGIIFGFQDAGPFEDNLDHLDEFAARKVKIFQLAYNSRSAFGDGCLMKENRGLTPLGREAVERMNHLKVVVDMSHTAPRTAYEGLKASSAPPVISHTGCRAVYDHPRSQPDDVLRMCAEKGGAVGIYLMPFLGLDPNYPTRNLLVRHIEHALNVCGEDHVGIGSDMSVSPVELTDAYMAINLADIAERKAKGIAAPLEELPVTTPDLNSARRMELIAEALADRKLPPRVIEKVLGGNFSRVFQDVWAA